MRLVLLLPELDMQFPTQRGKQIAQRLYAQLPATLFEVTNDRGRVANGFAYLCLGQGPSLPQSRKLSGLKPVG
jgi:hypothetical protein